MRCSKALNVLRVLSHTSWGADRKYLLIMYKTLVASKVAYGCEVYSSVTKNKLSILDPIHNAGIRLASGACKSSPIASLLVDTGELPLDSCCQILLIWYWYRVQRLPDCLTYSCVFNKKSFVIIIITHVFQHLLDSEYLNCWMN